MTRILVVDDEPQILRALATNLRARNYDVDLAATGEEALTIAARKHPDLVIVDLGLPTIDGVEVIRGLRGWTEVPIIVLSVREGEGDKVDALDAGADDYVTKPSSAFSGPPKDTRRKPSSRPDTSGPTSPPSASSETGRRSA